MGQKRRNRRLNTRAQRELQAIRRQPTEDDLSKYPGPGAVNGYLCPICGGVTLTIHVDHGVTPMFLACRATPDCQGRAHSMMYNGVVTGAPQWEWYRPGRNTWRRNNDATRHHLMQGGLLLRPYTPPAQTGELIEENDHATG